MPGWLGSGALISEAAYLWRVARGTPKEELVQSCFDWPGTGRWVDPQPAVFGQEDLVSLLDYPFNRTPPTLGPAGNVYKEAPGSFEGLSCDAKYSTEHSLCLRV